MSIGAILLFGSLARGDHSDGSDTDLLAIASDDRSLHVSVGRLSMFVYPWPRLESDAEAGDLFACHLVHEAKVIFDPDDYLSKLKSAFRFRSDYRTEIGCATDLGWFLARFGDRLNSALLVKRTLWCVRTILIARSAERREPVFAPRILAEQTRSASARQLLSERLEKKDDGVLRRALRLFLTEEANVEPFHEEADQEAFVDRFVRTSNKVALQTLSQEEKSKAGYL